MTIGAKSTGATRRKGAWVDITILSLFIFLLLGLSLFILSMTLLNDVEQMEMVIASTNFEIPVQARETLPSDDPPVWGIAADEVETFLSKLIVSRRDRNNESQPPRSDLQGEVSSLNPVSELKQRIDQLGEIVRRPQEYGSRRLADVHMSLASAYAEREQYDGLSSNLQKASEHYNHAVAFYENLRNDPEISRLYVQALTALADVHRRVGRHELARQCIAKIRNDVH